MNKTVNEWAKTLDDVLNIKQAVPAFLHSYPRGYLDFIENYLFDVFEYAGVIFWANSDGFSSFNRDKHLDHPLIEQGYLPFGQPSDGSYDRVCFDMNRHRKHTAPIVRIDHEAMLMREEVSIVAEIADSFECFCADDSGRIRTYRRTI